ncbi:hypothetical protein [Geodermatophilus sp. SYSU D00766]
MVTTGSCPRPARRTHPARLRWWWLHRVVDEADGRVLIAGDDGMVDGWTNRAEVADVLLDRD